MSTCLTLNSNKGKLFLIRTYNSFWVQNGRDEKSLLPLKIFSVISVFGFVTLDCLNHHYIIGTL